MGCCTLLGHWQAEPDRSGQTVHSAGFAPAFTLSQGSWLNQDQRLLTNGKQFTE